MSLPWEDCTTSGRHIMKVAERHSTKLRRHWLLIEDLARIDRRDQLVMAVRSKNTIGQLSIKTLSSLSCEIAERLPETSNPPNPPYCSHLLCSASGNTKFALHAPRSILLVNPVKLPVNRLPHLFSHPFFQPILSRNILDLI